MIGYVSTSVNSGFLIARWGVGTVLITSGGLLTLVQLGFASAPAWEWFVGVGLVSGAALGAFGSCLNGYAATHFTRRHMTWLHASFGIGVTVGPALMTVLLTQGITWRWGYVLVSVLFAVLTLWLIAIRTGWLTMTLAIERETPSIAQLLRKCSTQPMGWILVAIFFVYPLEGVIGQWAYTLFTESRAIPIDIAGSWISLYWGTFTFGRFLAGIAVDRMGATTLVRLSTVGLIAGAVLLWVPFNAWLNLVGLIVMGFAFAPMYPVLIAQVPQRIDPVLAPSLVGILVSAGGLGGAAWPGLAGVLVQQYGLEVLGGYFVGLAVLLLLLHELLLRVSPVH
jgi:fucose permease